MAFAKTFKKVLPKTVQCLAFEEGFDRALHIIEPGERCRPMNPGPGLALARVSRNFEELSVAFVMDAKDFFENFPPYLRERRALSQPLEWRNLRTLALTAQLLDPAESEKCPNDLLQAAGHAARGMRRLEVLEIWNNRKGAAAVFRYEKPQLVEEQRGDY
ncbi:hypothetical protein DL765_011769 [Monosporascus sp. GIB2]|nr:hypothetical protein DL765_011769 [Monosporascus sp. GIB2]